MSTSDHYTLVVLSSILSLYCTIRSFLLILRFLLRVALLTLHLPRVHSLLEYSLAWFYSPLYSGLDLVSPPPA